MRVMLHVHVLTVAISASYLTLGVANPGSAADLWWAYALVTFALAIVNLITERREPHDA
jgi:hypothetical protein